MNKKGFTLIEIIICLVLLSIIATTFIISLNKNKLAMLPCPCNPSFGSLLLKGLLLEKLMLLVGFKEVLLFFQPFKLKC